jgi:pimeloyl-ACP methyl ester carboxylesterase
MSAEALQLPLGPSQGALRRLTDRFGLKDTAATPRLADRIDVIPPLMIEAATVEHKSLQVFGRRIETYHITPNADIPPQGRIFFANGWRVSVRDNKEYIRHLVQAGYTVTSFDNDVTRGDITDIKAADQELQQRGKHSKIAFIKATAVREALQAFPLEPDKKASIVAHSEGTIYSGLAAALDPEKFNCFIQINSAGHAKQTSIPGIIVKGGYESVRSNQSGSRAQDSEPLIAATDIVKYVLRNFPIAIAELRTIAGTSTNRLVKYLQEEKIQTGCIWGRKDRLFPGRNLRKHIENGLFTHTSEVPDGTHDLSSSPVAYAKKTIEMIDEMRIPKLQTAGTIYQA